MTFKEVQKILISNGWKHVYTKGSHYYYEHCEIKGKISIPKHRRRCKKRNSKCYTKTGRFKMILQIKEEIK